MESETGKVCLACQQPFTADDPSITCSECHALYHQRCWDSRGGCAMPDCKANPAVHAPMPGAAPPPPIVGVLVNTAPPRGNGLATASLVLGIVGLVSCGLLVPASIIGLILGIVALNNAKKTPQIGGQNLAVAGIVTSAAFILVMPILASILFPVAAKSREKARQATCNSNQRQLALAIQMYAQDNGGQYPGADWANQISPYLGSSAQMFACPSDGTADSGVISYGYSSALVLPNGQGVKEKNVLSPSEVGAICDAGPSTPYPAGGLVGNGMTPENRHSKGLVISYCDGHAKYIPKGYVKGESGNEVVRAFDGVRQAGLLE